MKKIITAAFLFSICLPCSFSQISFPNQETIQAFLKSKTYIVLENAMISDFNQNIREAAEKHWTITPFEVIDLTQFEMISNNPQASFLMVVIGEYTGISKNTKQNILTLIMGDKSGNINKMPEILSVPLSYYIDENDDAEEEDYGYKLGGILEGMQYAIKNIFNQKVNLNNLKDLLNASKKDLKTIELWLTKYDLSEDVNTLEKIQKIYPYKVVITTQEAIQEAITNKKSNIAFVHKIGNNNVQNSICIKTIISCVDGKILYGDFHNVSPKEPDGLLPKDFENLKQ